MDIPIIHNTLDINNISVLEGERYNEDYYIWPIEYNKKHMFIQSSYLNISNALQYFNNISLSSYHKPIQDSKKLFNILINNIDTFMVAHIKKLKKKIKYRKKIIYKKCYTIQNKYIYYNFKLQQYNKIIMCDIYDENKKKQNVQYIQPGSNAYAILWLKNIWLKDNKVGLNYIVVQLKVYKNIIYTNKCLIIEDNDICAQTHPIHQTQQLPEPKHKSIMEVDPLYRTYVKMLKMGVPKRAVQMKMKMNGLDPTILDKIGTCSHSNKYNTSIQNNLNSNILPIDLLSGIKHTILKKVKKNKKNKKKIILNKLGVSRRSGVPTLEEILNIKNNLKKINYNIIK